MALPDSSEEDTSGAGVADTSVADTSVADTRGNPGTSVADTPSLNGGQRGGIPLYSDYKKRILYVPIFLSSSLPKKGWIQCCIVCSIKTAKVFYYFETINRNVCYMIFCCRNCKADIDTNDTLRDQFEFYVYDYIDTHQDYIFKKADKLIAHTQTQTQTQM
jgi:hypothetical protein